MNEARYDKLGAIIDQLSVEHCLARGRRFQHLDRADLIAAYIENLTIQVRRRDREIVDIGRELAGEISLRGDNIPPADAAQAFWALFNAASEGTQDSALIAEIWRRYDMDPN